VPQGGGSAGGLPRAPPRSLRAWGGGFIAQCLLSQVGS